MPPALVSFVESLAHVRPMDVLDVVLIAGCIYGVAAWVRRRVSKAVGFGLLTVGLLYAAAEWLDLYLTTLLLRGGLTIVLIALVVAFQDDIRRLFERMRTIRWQRRPKATQHAEQTVRVLVQAVSQLAQKNIGALVVLPGREALDVHLHGGVRADAELSVELLESIFHPSTPGHDGAIVVREGKMSRFGVHLPLSKNLEADARYGTRHASAVGLSERSDATVLVISEERGTVAMAREGRLRLLASKLDLEAELRGTLNPVALRAQRRTGRRRWVGQPGLKLASLSLAALLWTGLAHRVEPVQRTYKVPIEYRGLREGWQLNPSRPIEVRVNLSGSERAFDRLDAEALKVSIDLDGTRAGPQRVSLTEAYLNEPPDIDVVGFEPQLLRLSMHRMLAVEVPVKPDVRDVNGQRVAASLVRVEPAAIELLVPQHLAAYFDALPTEPIAAATLRRGQSAQVDLLLPPQSRLASPEDAQVRVYRVEPPAEGPA